MEKRSGTFYNIRSISDRHSKQWRAGTGNLTKKLRDHQQTELTPDTFNIKLNCWSNYSIVSTLKLMFSLKSKIFLMYQLNHEREKRSMQGDFLVCDKVKCLVQGGEQLSETQELNKALRNEVSKPVTAGLVMMQAKCNSYTVFILPANWEPNPTSDFTRVKKKSSEFCTTWLWLRTKDWYLRYAKARHSYNPQDKDKDESIHF